MLGLEGEGDKLAEIVFHSFWGTFSEDLGVLSKITDRKEWSTRSELGPIFQKTRVGTKLIEVGKIFFEYFCKLISGNVSNHTEGQSGQLSHNPIFAGNRSVTYSAELTNALRKPDQMHNYSQDFNGLCEEIMTIIKKSISDTEGLEQDWGNVEWKKLTRVAGPDLFQFEASKIRVACSGKYFLS